MGRKDRREKTKKEDVAASQGENITPLGWKIVAAGALCVLAGFFTLSKVDRMGKNLAADLAPLLILGGYALIGLGIFASPEKEGEASPSSAPPSNP